MSRENSQLSRNKVKDLIAELSNLLARENICDSHSLIINMTPKL